MPSQLLFLHFYQIQFLLCPKNQMIVIDYYRDIHYLYFYGDKAKPEVADRAACDQLQAIKNFTNSSNRDDKNLRIILLW